jgi:hypothetical protein
MFLLQQRARMQSAGNELFGAMICVVLLRSGCDRGDVCFFPFPRLSPAKRRMGAQLQHFKSLQDSRL